MRINGATKIYGIIGYPVKHSFSPLMHNAAFQALGMNAAYLPFEVAPKCLEPAARSIAALGILGLNVTVPYKEKIPGYLDEIDGETALIGAVNTVVVKNGKTKGHNTDGKGFVKSLYEEFGISPGGKKFFIMGAGGAARAISFSLALEGAERIVLADDVPRKAAILAEALTKHSSCDAIALKKDRKGIKAMLLDADVFVNATPCGMKPHDPKVIDSEFLRRGLFVYDIIYNPRATALLMEARAKGAKTANGLGMLLNQGALSFKLWTGRKAPARVMRNALAGIF